MQALLNQFLIFGVLGHYIDSSDSFLNCVCRNSFILDVLTFVSGWSWSILYFFKTFLLTKCKSRD